MNKDKRKELINEYKLSKPEMGVYMFYCKPLEKVYLGADQNLKGTLNSIQFQLKTGRYPANHTLEKEWKEYGAENFSIEVLEILEYDKEKQGEDGLTIPPRTDYSKDLEVLKEFWHIRLEGEGKAVADINTRFKRK